MHYHVLRIDEAGEHVEDALTFGRQEEAEERAATLAREIDGPGWTARRYPGRTWRQGELAVYLDRRPLERSIPCLELTIIRCCANGADCWLVHRGRPG